MLVIILSINCFDTRMAYAEEEDSVIEAGVYIGEEQVREYMESRGMIYNPEVLAIYTNIEETQATIQPRIDINLDVEFEIRNPNNYRYIDTSDTLEDSTRPAGQVTVHTSYTKAIDFSVESTDARYALELVQVFYNETLE